MKSLKEGKIVVVAGFQGIDEEGNITTLGRGGSDTTAVAISASLKADRCDIYTDVDGVYTADPRIVKNAKKLSLISHDEMLELASMGAKVLHDRSVIFAMKYDVPLRVVSTFIENKGTLVVKENLDMEDMVITGIAKKNDETQVNISGIPDRPGVASGIFNKLGESNINVNMIVQSVGRDSKSQISFTVLSTDINETKKIMDELKKELSAEEVSYNQDIAIVSVVGIGMRSHSGVAASVFDVLAKAGINIQMISTSEIKISVVIMKDRADDAMRLLHKRFFGE
jgi:aspartate kinase